MKIVDVDQTLKSDDVVLVTGVIEPQGTYELVKHKIEHNRLLTLKLLYISRGMP